MIQTSLPIGKYKGRRLVPARENGAAARVALERSRSGKRIEAQEEERRRIGRELHDGLSQQLAMFVVELGMLARQASSDATTLVEPILNLRQRAEALSDDLRHISHQLHPAVLEHLGLESALRSLCGDYTSRSGVCVSFGVDGESFSVPRSIANCLYRITQEALRNVVKHSGVSEAWVRIGRNGNAIQLSIIDKGVGFSLALSQPSGLGLISIKERVRMVQGRLHIESAPNEGTVIRITVPVICKEK